MLKRRCHICDKDINDKYYIRHIFSMKHSKNISLRDDVTLNIVLSLKQLARENNRYFDKSFQ